MDVIDSLTICFYTNTLQ